MDRAQASILSNSILAGNGLIRRPTRLDSAHRLARPGNGADLPNWIDRIDTKDRIDRADRVEWGIPMGRSIVRNGYTLLAGWMYPVNWIHAANGVLFG